MTTYEIVTRGGRWATVRVLPSGEAAGYDAVADRNDEQRHFAIHRDTRHATAIDTAFADSRQYSTREEAAADLARSGRGEVPAAGISAAQAFDLKVLGRAEHGGQRWIVFQVDQFRHVVEEGHFLCCGYSRRQHDADRRAEDFNEWCSRGLWAHDDVAADVAGLCDLTHVHSSMTGNCGRVEATATA
jgi:hypothetical protein